MAQFFPGYTVLSPDGQYLFTAENEGDSSGVPILTPYRYDPWMRDRMGSTSDSPATSATANVGLLAHIKRVSALLDSAEIAPGSAVAITTNTVAATISARNARRLGLEINNTGGSALTDFKVEVRYHSSGTWNAIASTDAAFTTGTGAATGNVLVPVIRASTNPRSLAASGVCYLELNIEGHWETRLVASGSGASLTVGGVAKK